MPSRASIAAARLPHGGTVCKCVHPNRVIIRPAKPAKAKAPAGVKLKNPGHKNPGQKKIKPQSGKGKGKGTASPCDCKYFPPQG